VGCKLHRQPQQSHQRRSDHSGQHARYSGSLGIAISEAIEAAVTDSTGQTRYSLGSVLNHVLLHQTIIGLEAKAQLKKAGEKLPDIVIGCAGVAAISPAWPSPSRKT